MVLLLRKLYNVREIFHKIIGLTHSTIFFSQMKQRNITINQLNYEILPKYETRPKNGAGPRYSLYFGTPGAREVQSVKRTPPVAREV